MASQIATFLSAEYLHASLPLTSPTSLNQTLQSLFLIECPVENATVLNNIRLNAAFLEYLPSQRVSRIELLLKAWRVESLKESEKTEEGDEKEEKKDKEEEKDSERESTDKEILDEVEKYIRDGVNQVCVYFEGQEVGAIIKMEEIRVKIDEILERGPAPFWPSIICRPREVV